MQTIGNMQQPGHVSQVDDEIVLHTFNLDHDHDHDLTCVASPEDQSNNCKSDQIASVPTNSSADANLSDGIVLTNEDQVILATPEKSPSHKDQRKISEELFEEAYRERKMDNLKHLKQYEDSRSRYCFLYIELLKQIENTLYQKTNQSKLFVTELLTFFTEVVATYRLYAKECTKSSLLSGIKNPTKGKNKAPLIWYPGIELGIWKLTDLRQDYIQDVRKFYRWVEKQIIPKVNNILKDYNNNTNRRQKDVQKLQQKIQQKEKIYLYKLNKIFTSLTAPNENEASDLLSEEFELFNLYENLKSKNQQIGKLIITYWSQMQSSQESLFLNLKKLVKEYLVQFNKINKQSQKSQQTLQICNSLEAEHQELYQYVWERNVNQSQRQQIAEIVGFKISSRSELQLLINMNTVSTKIPEFLIATLTTKRFKALIESKAIDIFCTVDGYLIFFTQETRSRMVMRNTTKELEGCTVTLKQRQKGIFKDTIRKQTLKFQKPSDAQEFMFYAEKDEQKKESFCLAQQ